MRTALSGLITSFFFLSFAAHANDVELVPLQHVRLLPSPFQAAQETNLQYLLALQPDRLLAPYRLQAGLESPTPGYGNWEEDGLDGHIGGHYLSALAMMYTSTGDEQIKQRLDYMLTALEEVQAANGDGYIGGVPDSHSLWNEIRAGNIEADLFILNDKWVPWYNLDKVFSGLRDVYVHTGDEKALRLLTGLGEWALELVSDLTDAQIQAMLVSEHGALNAVFADLYDFTSDPAYLRLAQQFSHQQILQPLAQRQDNLDGLHANTQIPKALGFERIYSLSGEQNYGDAAEYFWHTVTSSRTVSIGGNSVREHFHPKDDFFPIIEDVEGPETCNSYNMLKLSKLLYQRSADTRYIQYYERTLYNHILSSQHPDHGGLVYFTPMRPNHYRVYSAVEDGMWCCVGSGIENHSKYGLMIYAHQADTLYINLFIPSELAWEEQGIHVTMETHFPDDDSVHLTFNSATQKTIKIRYPDWVEEGQLSMAINGESLTINANPGEYIEITRDWQENDQLSWHMPMQLSLEQLPDGSDYYSVLYGPVVLGAKTAPSVAEQLSFVADNSRMGHIASGPQCALENAPMFVADDLDFLDKIQRLPGSPLTFKVVDEELIQPAFVQPTYLIPFFRIHDARYTLYWPYSPADNVSEFRETQLRQSQSDQQLRQATIDSVTPGEQQPEADHYFQGEHTRAGVNNGHHWRDARGWFSYRLSNPNKEANVLRITYWGTDTGRQFDVLVNDTRLASEHLRGEHGPALFSREYVLPEHLRNSDVLIVRFQANPGSIAGGVYGVDLLRESLE